MAAQDEDHAAFDEEEDDLDDTEGDDSDMDDDEEVAVAGGGQSSAPPPPPPPVDVPDLTAASSQPDHQNNAVQVPVTVAATPDLKRPRIEERRPPPSASLEESRRLFQRLWTDDDEIKILKGFLEFTSSRGTTFASHQYDTGPFYDQIKNELQLDFNKNQLIEKLRRLKKKYRNTANRLASRGRDFTFRNPHERSTYEISRRIWSASIKVSHGSEEDDLNPIDAAVSSDRKATRSRRRDRKMPLMALPATPTLMLPPPPAAVKVEVKTAPRLTAAAAVSPELKVPSNPLAPQIPAVVEETVKSCLSPIFKELLSAATSAPQGLGLNLPPLLDFGGNLGNLTLKTDARWRKQQILELEVYLKRVELLRDQIKLTLDEMKGSQSAAAPASS